MWELTAALAVAPVYDAIQAHRAAVPGLITWDVYLITDNGYTPHRLTYRVFITDTWQVFLKAVEDAGIGIQFLEALRESEIAENMRRWLIYRKLTRFHRLITTALCGLATTGDLGLAELYGISQILD
jgi:hypothetical protein